MCSSTEKHRDKLSNQVQEGLAALADEHGMTLLELIEWIINN